MKPVVMTLGDVCTKGSSNLAQKDLDGNSGEYEIYGASGLIKKVNFFHQEKPYIAVVKDGAGVGRTMLLPAKTSVIGTMQYIIPNENIDIEYLYYAITYMDLSRYYMGAAIPHIYFKDYCKEKILVPDIDIQKAIAHKFRIIDGLITARQEQLAKLWELIASRFIEMFGDPATNPMRWTESTIGAECYYIKDGPHKSLTDIGKENGGHPFISVRNIVNGFIDFSTAKYISDDDFYEAIKKCHPEKGDMLYSKGGTTGIAKLIDIDETFANWVHVAVLKFNKDRINGIFFENMLNSSYCFNQSQKLTKGIANRDLVLSAMSQIKIICPPLDLQNQFAEFVKQTDKSKLAVQKSLEQLETLKKSLMQKYFG